MLRPIATLVLLASLVGLPAQAGAQAIAVTGGDVDLYVPVSGGGFGIAVDQSTGLLWRGAWGGGPHKVTVETDLLTQQYTLGVEALVQAWFASGTGRVALTAGAPPQDLIVNIYTGFQRTAALRYDATASPSVPSGMDVHTVLFTITQQ